MERVEKTKKPAYKRVWFWLLLSPALFAVLFVSTAVVIGISGGFDEELNQRVDATTQPITQAATSTALPIPRLTSTQTIEPTNPSKPSPTPMLTPTMAPTIAPTKTPEPTPTQTPKPTIKPTPTTRPTPTPSSTLDPAEAPYGLDINGNPGPDFITLISVFEYWLEGYLGEDVKISVMEEDWEIGKSNFRYILTTKCRIPYKEYDIIMKIEFDETYETYEVFQLKINGINIDL